MLNCMSVCIGSNHPVTLWFRFILEFPYRFAIAFKYPCVSGCITIALFPFAFDIEKLYHDFISGVHPSSLMFELRLLIR